MGESGGSNPSTKNAKAEAEAEAAGRLMSFASMLQNKDTGERAARVKMAEQPNKLPRTHETREHEPFIPSQDGSSHNEISNGLNKNGNGVQGNRGYEDNLQSPRGEDDASSPGRSNHSTVPPDTPMSNGGDLRSESPSSENGGSMDGKDVSQRSYFVKHDYRDHANVRLEELSPVETEAQATGQRSNRGGVKMLFPEKLHQLLTMSPDIVDPSIISWAPHGRCFSVHNTREFTRELMPKYFNHNAITSFQRQLNLYGFKRITKAGSKDQGAYYHELFLRGRPTLCRRMRRQKIKGTGYKPLPDPDNEPDFYSMPPCFVIVDEKEREEQEILHRNFNRSSSSPLPDSLPIKRSAFSLESEMADRKNIRRDLEQDASAYAARADLMTRAAAEDAALNNVRRLSLLGSMQSNPRRISLPDRSTYNLPMPGVPGTLGPGEFRRGSLPLSSGRDMNGRFTDSLGRFTGRDMLSDRMSSPLGNRDSILQELLARARTGSDASLPLGRGNLPSENAIRSELEVLEQSRRNIVMQQQRLQLLMDQAHAAKRSSLGLGGDFSGAGMGGIVNELERRASLSGGGRGIGELERRASLLAAGRFMEPRGSMGGLEAAFGNAARRASMNNMGISGAGVGSMQDAQLAANRQVKTDGEPRGDVSTSAVYNTLASMVSSGRFTNSQLDEIELMLQTGRNKAAAAAASKKPDGNDTERN